MSVETMTDSPRTALQLLSSTYIGRLVDDDIAHALVAFCVADATVERHLHHPHFELPPKQAVPQVVVHRSDRGRRDLEDELKGESSNSAHFVQTLVDGVLCEAQENAARSNPSTYSNRSTYSNPESPVITSDACGNIVSTSASIAVTCAKESKCDVESCVRSTDHQTAAWSDPDNQGTSSSTPVIWTDQASSESQTSKPILWSDTLESSTIQHRLPRTPTQSPEASSPNSPSPYQSAQPSPVDAEDTGLWIGGVGHPSEPPISTVVVVAPVISRLRLGEQRERQFSIESDLSTERGHSSIDSDDETDFPPPREEDEDLLARVEQGLARVEQVGDVEGSSQSDREDSAPRTQAPSPPTLVDPRPIDDFQVVDTIATELPSSRQLVPSHNITFDHLEQQGEPVILNSEFRSAKSRRKASTTSPGRKASQVCMFWREIQSEQAKHERAVSAETKDELSRAPVYLFENSSESDVEDMAESVEDDYEDIDASQFVYECHTYHNELRARHSAPPIELDEDMCELAHKWARRLTRKKFMTYAEYTAVGESVTFFPAHFSGRQAMGIWAAEAERYDYEQPGWQVGTNYFTQMIWRNTTHVGVGRALMPRDHLCTNVQCSRVLKDSSTLTLDAMNQRHAVVVLLYRPSGNGNRPGEFERNVRLPLELRPDTTEDENR